MGFSRRAFKRFLESTRLSSPPRQPAVECQDTDELAQNVWSDSKAEEERKRALAQATELWGQGEKRSAFEVMRQARFEHGISTDLQFEYGRRAFEEGHYWAAREAFHDAVQLDCTRLDAIEMFLEANYASPGAKGVTTQALSNLARVLPFASTFDHEAASLLLPSMQLVAVVDEKVRMLRYSEDQVAQHIGYLAGTASDDWGHSADAEVVEKTMAKLIIALARRDYHVAYRLLDVVSPDIKPKRALRLAIRKELRNNQYEDARMLLEHYRSIDPEDVWSRQQLKKLKRSNRFLSNYELTTKGFPLPNGVGEAAYVPNHSRIFYLLHTALPHHSVGYATRTHGLLRGIRSHGWDVQGVTRLGYPYDMPNMDAIGPIEPTVIIDGVPYHRLSTTEGLEKKAPIQRYIARYAKALKKFAAEGRPFVLHAASNHWNGLAGVTAARQLGIPSIYEVRGLWEITRGSRNPEWMGGPMYEYMARLETDAARNADRVITITNALRDELIQRGVNGDKISVVPNGVETSRFRPRVRNQELAERLGVHDKTVVGYVGTILDYEGIELLIDVAGKLKEEREDVAFLLVGDGAELPQFRERVERENLADIMMFTGRIPHHEVEDYYSIIDICPFPRLPLPVTEIVSPLKPFEAMAMQKAVIVSSVAALAEIVTDGTTGLIFTKGSSDSLAEKLRLLLDDSGLRKRLASSGREWVERERDWESLSEDIGQIYASLGGHIKEV